MKFSTLPLSIQHAMRAGEYRAMRDQSMHDARVSKRIGDKVTMLAKVSYARVANDSYVHWLICAVNADKVEHAQTHCASVQELRRTVDRGSVPTGFMMTKLQAE